MRAQVKRITIHSGTRGDRVGDIQLQRYQLRREHVSHVRRRSAQQPASEGGVAISEGMQRPIRVYQLARVEQGHNGPQ